MRSGRFISSQVTLALSVFLSSTIWAAAANILPNPGFELGFEGWQTQVQDGKAEDVSFLIDKENVLSGSQSAVIVSKSPSVRAKWYYNHNPETGLRQGQMYHARVWVKHDKVNPDNVRIRLASHGPNWTDYEGVFLKAVATKDGWTEMSGSLVIPQAKPWNVMLECFLWRDAGTVWLDDAELRLVSEGPAKVSADKDTELREVDQWWVRSRVRHRPSDGETVATTPPTFLWPLVKGATHDLQYSSSSDFSPSETVTVENLGLNMHTGAEVLAPGTWYWRVRARDKDGMTSAWEQAREFVIPDTAVAFTLPPTPEILEKVPTQRPRLFVTADTLEAFRESRFTDRRLLWSVLQPRLTGYLSATWMKEPASIPAGKVSPSTAPDLFQTQMRDSRRMADAIEHLAFTYLATGDRSYADKAKEGMLEFCRWDPNSTSSWAYNDEIAMSIIMSVPRVYDWIYDTLTPEERSLVLSAMRARGDQVYAMLRGIPYEDRPFTSHPTRVINFLGQAALAFLGEIPEAAEWFDYVINIYYAFYPPWGDTDGGYSEGPNYGSWYLERMLQFMHAVQTATGIDLHQKPFYRNTGYFYLYTHPPYAGMSPFGDPAFRKPDSTEASNMMRLASVYRNPYFKWYSEKVPKGPAMDKMLYFWIDPTISREEPDELPSSRAFKDVGVVAMHTELSRPADNVMVLFKSSPYGSQSHAYPEQNTFYIEAFGEPLAISSGYYPYYGSPHHSQWTWQTIAHNGILVNGEGQQPRSASAAGEIVDFLGMGGYDYTLGNAVRAYAGRLSQALRHVLFVKPGYVIIFDELASPRESSYTWLLHSLSKMKVDEDAGSVLLQQGKASLQVQFVTPVGLKMEQTDQFTVPPEDNSPNQWHFSATTQELADKAHFLAVLVPYKTEEGNPTPDISAVATPEGWWGVRVAGSDWQDVSLLRGAAIEEGAKAEAEGIATDGSVVTVRKSQNGDVLQWFVRAGKNLSVDGKALLKTDAPADVSVNSVADGYDVQVCSATAGRVAITLAEKPSEVKASEGMLDGWSYQADTNTLSLDVQAGSVQITVR